MKLLALSMGILIAIPAMGQNTGVGEKPAGDATLKRQKTASSAPSLADTEKWIENTFDDNNGRSICWEFDSSQPGSQFGPEFHCQNQSYSLEFEGCRVKLRTFNSHGPCEKEIVCKDDTDKRDDSIVEFNLGDVDPKTIRAQNPMGQFGPLDRKTYHANPSSVEVCIATTNSEPKMTLVFSNALSPPQANANLYKESKLCGIVNNFVTVQPEYAPRFVKALTHAVELCGGKPSTF